MLYGRDWGFYTDLLDDLERTGQRLRIAYDRGEMELFMPGDPHERLNKSAAMLLEAWSMETRTRIYGLGSVTCRRRDTEKGLEPDDCYYVHRDAPPISRGPLDMKLFGAPDLVMEVEVTEPMLPRLPVYAGLGVAEIWLLRPAAPVKVLRLVRGGKYHEVENSVLLPEFPMKQFARALKQASEGSQFDATVAWRDWLRKNGLAK